MKILLVLLNFSITLLSADVTNKFNNWFPGINLVSLNGELLPYPEECGELLKSFAEYASNLTFCCIQNSVPIRLCENCIVQYVKFHEKYNKLATEVVNGTSCGTIFMSNDRLNVVKDYHDSIESVWKNGNCDKCYDWNGDTPTLKNDTINFNLMYNDTLHCISSQRISDDDKMCIECYDRYVQLDSFYKTLSNDAIGVDSVCMDIVDSMNTTRSIWSKKCCNLRRKPEIAFLCFASVISILPIIFYLVVRFYGPIRDLPNVLKQSRFKQSLPINSESTE